MKILNIGWLYCENCDDDGMVVKTEKGCGLMLYQGDKFVCPRCGGGGEIEIVNDIATAYKPSRIALDEKIKFILIYYSKLSITYRQPQSIAVTIISEK